MSDLISRQAVIEVLKQTGIIQDNDLGHLVVDEINRIPIAYDVDKVVEQMKEEEMPLEDSDGNYVSCVVVSTRDAEMIIRAGGMV